MNEEYRLQIKIKDSATSGSYGIVGKPTEIVDLDNNKLFVGDVVEVTSPSGAMNFISMVVKSVDSRFPFVMGIAGLYDKRGMLPACDWKVKRVRSFSSLKVNEEIHTNSTAHFIIRPY